MQPHMQQVRKFTPRVRNGPPQPQQLPFNPQMPPQFQFQPRVVGPAPPFPHQFAPPPQFMPMMVMPMPQFIQQAPMQPQQQMPRQPETQQASNPFVPLQASRKATKAKNGQDTKQELDKNDSVQTKTTETDKKEGGKSEVAKVSVATPNADKSKTPTVDTRKSRLAINFSAN